MMSVCVLQHTPDNTVYRLNSCFALPKRSRNFSFKIPVITRALLSTLTFVNNSNKFPPTYYLPYKPSTELTEFSTYHAPAAFHRLPVEGVSNQYWALAKARRDIKCFDFVALHLHTFQNFARRCCKNLSTMFPPLRKWPGKTVHGVEGWFVRTIMMIEILWT